MKAVGAVCRSVAALAAFVASLVAVAGGGATVASSACAILSGGRAVVGSGLALGAGHLGLVGFQRVADRCTNVALPGGFVARLSRTISGVSRSIGVVEVVLRGHGNGSVPTSQQVKTVTCRLDVVGRGSGFEIRRIGQPCRMPRARWSALASAENVPEIREAVVDFACANGISEALARDIRLAISEAVTNAVLHAYRQHAQPGSVSVFATLGGGWLELRVVDDGIGMAPRDDSPGIGLGLPLIYRLADQVELRRLPDRVGTEVWMRFRLDELAPAPRT